MSFLEELKRRNVFRVAVLYLVAGWVLLQVADVLFPALNGPELGINLILGFLILGFPLVLIFSWVYELTPEGLKREKDVDRSQSITPATGHKINVLIIILLIIAIGVVAADRLIPESGPDQAGTSSLPPPTETQADDSSPGESEESGEPEEPAHIAGGMFLNTAPKESVAVLPFVNMSGDPENEYFSDGLSEELLNALAGIDGMFVAARTSSFHFKGHTGDVGDIARQLKVRNILEGSVRKAGARVRITAQLIDATNGYHLWSETFDRQLDDVFAVQDEISRKVADALHVALIASTEVPVEKPTENMEAYLAYLRGQQHLHAGGTDGFRQAVAAFEDAVALDPSFAEAHAGIALAWIEQLDWGNISRDAAMGPIQTAADRAMSLNPDLSVALAAHAMALRVSSPDGGDDPRVIQTLERALALDPNNVEILASYANALQQTGRAEDALAPLERGLARDPLSASLQMNMGGALAGMGRYEAARQRLLSAMELAPEHPLPPDGLANIQRGLGRPDEALRLQQKVIQLDPVDSYSRLLVVTDYLDLGDVERAEQWQEAAESLPGQQETIDAVRALLRQLQGDRAGAVTDAEKSFAMMPAGTAAPLFARNILYGHYVAAGEFDRAIAARFGKDGLPPPPPAGTELDMGEALKVASAPYLIAARDGREAAREYARATLEWSQAIQDPGYRDRGAHFVRCYAHAALEQPKEAVQACRAGFMLNQQWVRFLLEVTPEPEPIRKSPEWQSFMAELRADRADKLARLRESGDEPLPH